MRDRERRQSRPPKPVSVPVDQETADLVAQAEAAEGRKEWLAAAEAWDGCTAASPGHARVPDWLARAGNALLQANRLDDSASRFRRLTDAFPQDRRGLEGSARVAQRRRDWREVARLCSILADMPGADARWLVAMHGDALVELGDYAGAAARYADLLAGSPADAGAHAGLATLAARQWKWRDAVDHWDRCIEGSPHPIPAYRLNGRALALLESGDIGRARAQFAMLAEEHPDRVDGLRGLATIASLQDRPAAVGECWDRCIGRFPRSPEGWLGKARFLLGRGDHAAAQAMAAEAVQHWPDEPAVAVLWAECATFARDWPAARKRWRSALERNPDDLAAQAGYAALLGSTGDAEGAETFFEAVAGDPEAALSCRIEYDLAREDWGSAARHASELAVLLPLEPRARLHLAGIRMREGSFASLDAARSLLEQLHAQAPDAVRVTSRLAEAYVRLGLDDAAVETVRSLPREDRRAEMESLRAWVRHRAGDEASARRIWRNIVERQYFAPVHGPLHTLERIDSNRVRDRAGDVALFTTVRNESPRLRYFLDYYRRLGVDRFVIVDNESTDDSVAVLTACPDVVLYRTSDRYDFSGYGMRWINELAGRHGGESWCLHVDADELLVFPHCESVGLRGLVDHMAANGQEAVRAVMLDMFPGDEPVAGGPDGADSPFAADTFDNSLLTQGFQVCPYREVQGGIRRRLFAGHMLMNKTPLIRGGSGIRFLMSSHRITPAVVSDVTAALLHHHLAYYLTDRFRPLFQESIDEGRFQAGSTERRRYVEMRPGSSREASLTGPDSVRFRSSEQLLELGIIQTGPGFPRPS